MISPTAKEERVRAALEEVLRWDGLSRSARLRDFLRYVVEAKLRGEEGAIKAYSVAVDVFGRSEGFDPQSDPIVRVQARRLRELLDRFYSEGHNKVALRIRIPVGRYVPEFEELGNSRSASGGGGTGGLSARPRTAKDEALHHGTAMSGLLRRGGGWLFTLVLAFFTGSLLFLAFNAYDAGGSASARAAEVPQLPRIFVSEFANLTQNDGKRPLAAGLAVELVTDLELFGDVEVVYGGITSKSPHPGRKALDDVYLLSGVAREATGGLQYSLRLARAISDETVWSRTVSVDGASGKPVSVDDIAREIAAQVGSPRGPLHARARTWVKQQETLDGAATRYVCIVAFHLYRDTKGPDDERKAEDCLDALLQRDGDFAEGLAAKAAMIASEAASSTLDPVLIAEQFHVADQMVQRAVDAKPLSSFVWEQFAAIKERLRASEEAQAALGSALQLNPANTDAMAALGRLLVMKGSADVGSDIALSAVAYDPAPPPRFYAAPALNALRERNYAQAILHAERLAQGELELGAVIAVAAAGALRRPRVIDRYLPVIFERHSFQDGGILSSLTQQISDSPTIERISHGLALAGIPDRYLAPGF